MENKIIRKIYWVKICRWTSKIIEAKKLDTDSEEASLDKLKVKLGIRRTWRIYSFRKIINIENTTSNSIIKKNKKSCIKLCKLF